jgi:RND family efflux transporter MFP subunit
MAIVLGVYFLLVWLIFSKLKLLPWNFAWKTVVYGIAIAVGLIVVGALQYITPSSSVAVVQTDIQKIIPLVSGRVETVNVAGTQSVSAGELLFALDPRPFQYSVDQAEASLELATIRLRDATTLVTKGAAPRASLDLYGAEVSQAQAVFDGALFDLENARVMAPANGIVSIVVLAEGDVVTAMQPVMNFFHSDELRIGASFKQNGLEKMRAGMPATVTFPASPGEVYKTEVAFIPSVSVQGQLSTQSVANPLESLLSSTGTYPVLVSFPTDAPEHLSRSGTQASVTVFTDEDSPINILAVVIQWIGAWMNFVF